jgi:radical SAM protein with 4Fe4S-binding SPASM domain
VTVKNHVLERVEAGDWQLEELSIELLNACRAKCRHCSSGAGVPMKGELTTEEVMSAMVQGRDLGATVLSLSGGDPILHPDLLLIIGYALDLGYEQVLLYTTGLWDTDDEVLFGVPKLGGEDKGVRGITSHPALEHLLELSKQGLVFVFSLDSADPTVMDFVRGVPGLWHAVTQGIKFLTKMGATVWVHYVPMRVNVDEVSSVRLLCSRLGVEKMSLLRFVPQTRGRANEDVLLPTLGQFRRLMLRMDVELSHSDRMLQHTSIRMGCPISFRHAENGTSIHQAGTGKVKLCHAGTDLILIRPDGSIHPCAAWKSLPTDSNIRTHSLEEIWEGDTTFQAIRDYLQTDYAQLEGDCGTCKDLYTCRGGCPAQRLHAFGKSLGDLLYPETDPMCPRRYWRSVGRDDV